MRFVLAGVLSLAVLAAGAIQVIADGAAGVAAAPASVPHVLAALIGDRPARIVGLRLHAASDGGVLATTARVDELDKAGDYREAAEMQRALVARLQHDPFGQEAYVDALWRLGQLDAEIGYREPANRRIQWQKALQDYKLALELAPLSETVLLAAGNQALLDGDRKSAEAYFSRAVSVDPSSADARVGLQKAKTGEGVPPPYVAPAEWARHKKTSGR